MGETTFNSFCGVELILGVMWETTPNRLNDAKLNMRILNVNINTLMIASKLTIELCEKKGKQMILHTVNCIEKSVSKELTIKLNDSKSTLVYYMKMVN